MAKKSSIQKIGSILILFLLCVVCYAEEPRITIATTPNPVNQGDQLQLRVEIRSSEAITIQSPEFSAPDFTIVGRSFEGSMPSRYENGKIVTEIHKTFSFVLFPNKSGALYIRNLSILVGKEHRKFPDILVKVEPVPVGQGKQSNQASPDDDEGPNPAAPRSYSLPTPRTHGDKDAPSQLNSDFTVWAKVSKERVYVGEPILIEYYLYDYGGMRQLNIDRWPTFEGFWKDDLELVSRYQFETVYANNRRMRRAFLGRFALFPMKPGKLPIGKLVISGQVMSGNSGLGALDDDDLRPFFFGGFGQVRNATHGTQDLAIDVMPLPTDGKPADFSGAVGNFTADLKADKADAPANTPVNLTLTFHGTGNFQAIEAPKLPFPADFELYETNSPTRNAIRTGGRKALESEKAYQYVVIPRRAGKFQIPEKKWSFFDPVKGSYQTVTINALDLNISENANASALPSNPSNPSSGSPMPPTIKDEALRYVKTSASSPSQTFVNLLPVLVVIFSLINIALLGLWVWPHRAKILALAPKTDPFKLLLERTANMASATGNQWLGDVEDIIYEGLQILLVSNPRGITRSELEDLWKGKSLPGKLFHETSAFLDQLDQARFSNLSTNEAKQSLRAKVLPRLKHLLQEFQTIQSRN